MKTKRNYVERKLRRMTGMSAEAQEAMHRANYNTLWRARCRNCGQWSIADYQQILKVECIGCGQPLGKRT